MVLAFDIGNTNIVMGGLDEEKIGFTARIVSDKLKTADEYALLIKGLLEFYHVDVAAIEGGIISSVVPILAAVCAEAMEKLIGKRPLVVGSGVRTGLNILIDNPAQLGADLVVDAVAALAEYKKPILIFDLGTATTLSVIDSKGYYLGGMIMPGVVLSMEALSSRTSQLPHISLEEPKYVVGRNTIDCMKSGVIYGHAAMLDGLITRVEEDLGEQATVVATGGLARKIAPHCKRKVICDDNLLLKGLLILYRKNVRG